MQPNLFWSSRPSTISKQMGSLTNLALGTISFQWLPHHNVLVKWLMMKSIDPSSLHNNDKSKSCSQTSNWEKVVLQT